MTLIRRFTGFEMSGDGYDYTELAQREGWRAHYSWGKDGWDLGDPPYVIYYTMEQDGLFFVRERCEGDLTTHVWDTKDEQIAYLDGVFRENMQRRPDRYTSAIGRSNEDLSGPFSWSRLNP